jgi:hypothetical protein
MSIMDCLRPQTPPPLPENVRKVEQGLGIPDEPRLSVSQWKKRPYEQTRQGKTRLAIRALILKAFTNTPQTCQEVATACGMREQVVRAHIPALKAYIVTDGFVRVGGYKVQTWRLKRG